MEQTGQFTIKTDDMELAGELIQSLITYLNITDLQVTCDFPDELDNLKQTLQKVFFSNSCLRNSLSRANVSHRLINTTPFVSNLLLKWPIIQI